MILRKLLTAVDPLGGTTAVGGNPLGGRSIGVDSPFNPARTGGAANGLELFISVILGFLTTIGSIMFLIYVVLGALNWITSGGDKGKVEAARSQITSAIVGLIIVVVSQTIVAIAGGVLGLNILNPAATLNNLIK